MCTDIIFSVLQDVNDNGPEFPGTYSANVSVTSPVGTIVQRVQATDRDTVSTE